MANVKFVVETDVAQTLRASKDVQRAQDKMERGFAEMGDAAQRANAETQAALRQTVAAYELAEGRMSSVRTRGATSRTVGGARSYALAPVASAPAHVQPFIPRFPGAGGGGGGGGRGGGGPRGPEPFGGIYQTKAEDDAHTEVVRRRWRREAAVRLGRERQAAEAAAAEERVEDATARRTARRRRLGELGPAAMYAGAGAAMLAHGVWDRVGHYRDSAIALDEQSAPLLGVGQNYLRRGPIRDEVLRMSSGMGIDRGQIFDARFGVESAASDLAPEVGEAIVRESAKFFKLQGSDMNTTARALTAAMTLVGDELEAGAKGVREFANELGYAADAGAFEINEVTPYLGMVLGAFKGMGYTRHDAEASMLIASRGGARPEQFSTATRNMALLMAEGEAKGTFKRTGSWAGDVRQLSAMESPELLDTFGRDAFTVAKMLVDNADALEMHTAKLKAMTGEMDVVGKKLMASWRDTAHATAEVLKAYKEAINNIPAGKSGEPAVQQQLIEAAGVDRAIEDTAHPFTPDWVKTLRKIAYSGYDNLGRGRASGITQDAVAAQISDMRAAGQHDAADFLMIAHGGATDSKILKPQARGAMNRIVYTGVGEAQEFAGLKAEGYNISGSHFLIYKQLLSDGKTRAAENLLLERRTPEKIASDKMLLERRTPEKRRRSEPAGVDGGGIIGRDGSVGIGSLAPKGVNRRPRRSGAAGQGISGGAAALIRQAGELNLEAAKLIEDGGGPAAGPLVGAGNNAPE